MTHAPTLLLCVGATKAGTTWLYEHLSAHPQCHLRAIKELHYFDTLENCGFTRQLKVQRAFAARLQKRLGVVQGEQAERVAQKLRDVKEWIGVLAARVEDVPAYLSYLSGGRGARPVVADITPAYALLPEDRLRQMAGMAPDVRVLYVMRDPVSRLWSHVRMLASRAAEGADRVPDRAFALLDRILAGETSGATERGDYIAALTKLWAAVDPKRLLVMFQEEMLTGAGLARLCAFLGIAPATADFGSRVHAGPALALSDSQRNRARALLRPQYEFVARHYPDLPGAWRRNMGEETL